MTVTLEPGADLAAERLGEAGSVGGLSEQLSAIAVSRAAAILAAGERAAEVRRGLGEVGIPAPWCAFQVTGICR